MDIYKIYVCCFDLGENGWERKEERRQPVSAAIITWNSPLLCSDKTSNPLIKLCTPVGGKVNSVVFGTNEIKVFALPSCDLPQMISFPLGFEKIQ